MSDQANVQSRPGLHVFLQTPPHPDPARGYEDALEVIELAETLGYETAWIAEAHFAPIALPSALVLLSAAAQRTTTIRLGTAVVPLIFDDPIRLAETAAVADYLSGGRLEFGVGKGNGGGFSSAAFAAFHLSEDDKESLYDLGLADLKVALQGEIVAGERTLQVYPPPQSLLARLWQSTANPVNAASIGRAGDGLLLHRVAFTGETGQVQSVLIDEYLDAYTAAAPPRIGVSRVVLPAASKAEALRVAEAEFDRNPAASSGFGATSAKDFLDRTNVVYGNADDIAEALSGDAAFVRSTDYLFGLPLSNASPEFHDALRIIADEIHPRLPVSEARAALV